MSETPSPASLEAARRVCEGVDFHEDDDCPVCTVIALALESYALSAVSKAVEKEREEIAKAIEARAAYVLSRQYGGEPYEFQAGVDMTLRLMAVLLPDLAAAIRSRGRAQQ